MSMATCTPNDWQFGPQIDHACQQFDFTLFFEATFLSTAPSAILLTSLAIRLWNLVGASVKARGGMLLMLKMVRGRAVGMRSGLVRLIRCTQTGIGLLMVLQIVFLVLNTIRLNLRHPAPFAAGSLAIAGTGAAILASFYEHTRSTAPSSILQTYFPTVILLNVARVRTLWLIGDAPSAIVLSIILSFEILIFSIESVWKTRYLIADTSNEEQSGLWDRVLFSWLLSMLLRGYSGTLSLACLPMIDSKLDSRALHGKLIDTWRRSKMHKHRARHSYLTWTRTTEQEVHLTFGDSSRLLATVCRCFRATAVVDGFQIRTALPHQHDHRMG